MHEPPAARGALRGLAPSLSAGEALASFSESVAQRGPLGSPPSVSVEVLRPLRGLGTGLPFFPLLISRLLRLALLACVVYKVAAQGTFSGHSAGEL